MTSAAPAAERAPRTAPTLDPQPPPDARLLLVCDHLGERLGGLLAHPALARYRTLLTRSLRESLEAIATERPDLLLLDPLSQGGAVELEALDRARGEDPPIPLLLVADAGRPEVLETAGRVLRGGAWDLIWSNARPDELRLRLERLEGTLQVLDQMQELRHRASHDDRTDLLRPQAFERRLLEHFSAAQRHGLHLALVLIDLDRFGQVNKRYDHTVGDRIIAGVGERIRRSLRAEDVAGRLGGDEFAVVLPYTRKVDVAPVIHRLREEIQSLSDVDLGAGERIPVSASIGFETYDGSDLESVATLRAHAERALRAAKQAGGNQAVYFRGLERRRDDAPEEG